ncbi:MAG TPA: DUF2795 domain-containing protein [Burkholderiales bacterium]
MKVPSPFRVQKFLGGLRYPACKRAVLERAREQGADGEIMRLLVRLPERPYESPVSLSREVGRQAANLPAH